MDNTSTPNTAKGPNVLMIISSILMVLLILSNSYILSYIRDFFDLSRSEMVAALITIILLFLEIAFLFLTFLTKLGSLSYEPEIMKELAMWVLIINCVLFLFCNICLIFFEDWTVEGHASGLLIVQSVNSFPGIIVSILALVGASKSK